MSKDISNCLPVNAWANIDPDLCYHMVLLGPNNLNLIVSLYRSVFRTTLSESEYEEISEETLDSLTEVFEDIGDQGIASSEYDVQFAVSNI